MPDTSAVSLVTAVRSRLPLYPTSSSLVAPQSERLRAGVCARSQRFEGSRDQWQGWTGQTLPTSGARVWGVRSRRSCWATGTARWPNRPSGSPTS